jgi:penicillin-binding protein 1C
LLKNYLESVKDKGISNGALVVLDNTTSEILSLIGSKDFFDSEHDGQVNGALALRQPGSALKPFTYGLALERGMTPASLIEDGPSQFVTAAGNYNPQNFDRKYHGVLSLRTALACSYNIPAVAVLQMIGPDLLYQRLKALGFESLKQSPGFYGLGLTLGNGEVSLLELVRAYSALPRQGVFLKDRSILNVRTKNNKPAVIPGRPEGKPVFPPPIAYIVTDILADKDARIPSFGYNTPLSFPFPVAAKTGTSKDFRDNWTIGYSPKYTVGVWVGNFDGKPMQNVSGITGCGPLFRDIMLLLHQKTGWNEFKEPEDIIRTSVCSLTGELPTAYCRGTVEEVFIKGTEPHRPCSRHQRGFPVTESAVLKSKESALARLEVAAPQNGDIFKLDPVLRKEHQRIKLKAATPPGFRTDKVEWWINGTKAGEAVYPYSIFWNLQPGSYTIKARIVLGNRKVESRPIRILVLA